MLWLQPLTLTLQLMGLSIALAATIGIPLAFFLSVIPRDRLIGRSVVYYGICTILGCIATPMILHAAAWEATAGKFGWLTFSQTAAQTYTGFAGKYTGFVAASWVHGVFGASIVTLATWFGTTRIPASVLDQCRLDVGPYRAWWRIRLAVAAPWVICGLLATAILAATEMTVVNLYSVRTLADEFYLLYAVNPSLSSVLSVLVVPAALSIALLGTLLVRGRRRFDVLMIDRKKTAVDDSHAVGSEAATLCCCAAFLLATFLFAFPFSGMVLKAGQSIVVTGGDAKIEWSVGTCVRSLGSALREYGDEYVWTAVIAVAAALACVPLAWVIASFAKKSVRFRLVADVASILMVLIPGPIVGLTVIHVFTLPIPGFYTIYHQTIVPTIVALLFRALPVAYWIVRAAYDGIDSSVRDASNLDFGWFRRMWSIDRPLLMRSLVIAGIASGLVASGDVPTQLPVLPPGVVTVGTRLFALLHSGARNQEAALAFWYVGSIILIGVALAFRWKASQR